MLNIHFVVSFFTENVAMKNRIHRIKRKGPWIFVLVLPETQQNQLNHSMSQESMSLEILMNVLSSRTN